MLPDGGSFFEVGWVGKQERRPDKLAPSGVSQRMFWIVGKNKKGAESAPFHSSQKY